MSALLMPGAVSAALPSDGRLGLGETIVFGVVALVTVACGIGVLTAKRAVTAAINMIGIMISLAVLYIVNESPFMGITQIVVYTGAVMTLVLFVIMLVGVGGDEPVSAAGSVMRRPLLILLGLGLVGVLTAVVWRTVFPTPAGLKDGAKAAPDLLAVTLYHDHVVTMELTAILLIIAAVGALTLTHRQRIRARFSQRRVAANKMQAYASKGVHPGQKPMPGVYASTNSAAAPALGADGETVEESVPRVLRARGQGLELSDVSPEMGLAQRSGTIISRQGSVGGVGDVGSQHTDRGISPCGGRPSLDSSSACWCSPSATGTGGSGWRSSDTSACICRGSSTRTAPSSASTRWPSSPSWCSPSPCGSVRSPGSLSPCPVPVWRRRRISPWPPEGSARASRIHADS